MVKLEGYMAGLNLGGWISQYGVFDHDHFKTFITEEDIQTIAGWGADHVRVPFDYPILEEDDNPGVYMDSGWVYLDNCLAWCKKYGLNLMLDMHKAPGFFFGDGDKNTLFTSEAMQKRFIDMWIAIVKRYRSEGQNVVYELLNEIVEPTPDRWNALATRAIKAIREVDDEHWIVVGGIDYNNVWKLQDMPIFDDPKIVYNFHMYEPFAMTHQFAGWSEASMKFNRHMYYPYADLSDYIAFARMTDSRGPLKMYEGLTKMDSAYLDRFISPAYAFQAAHPEFPLYCGEYGVIENADLGSREAWTEDLSELLLAHGIGRAVWNYKFLGFTHIRDAETRQTVSNRLVRAVCKH